MTVSFEYTDIEVMRIARANQWISYLVRGEKFYVHPVIANISSGDEVLIIEIFRASDSERTFRYIYTEVPGSFKFTMDGKAVIREKGTIEFH